MLLHFRTASDVERNLVSKYLVQLTEKEKKLSDSHGLFFLPSRELIQNFIPPKLQLLPEEPFNQISKAKFLFLTALIEISKRGTGKGALTRFVRGKSFPRTLRESAMQVLRAT